MIEKLLKDKRLPLILISSFAWSIVAHGMAFFNKYSYHDDADWVNGFNYSDTYGLGRWGRAVTGKLALLLFGGKHASTPCFLGLFTILCIALMLYIVCLRLRIDNRLMIVALSAVMVCTPAVTAGFGFMFTTPYFFLGSFLGVLGAYIYYSDKNVKTFLVCTVLMAFSTALYQANIPIDLIVLLLFMLDDVNSSDMTWKDYLMLGLKNVLICIVFIVEYFVSNKIALKIVGMEMSDYKGVGSYGFGGIMAYVMRVATAYKRFLKPADFVGRQGVSANMFPWSLMYYHILLVAVSIVLIAIFVKGVGSFRKIAQILILACISPLFAYFTYFMVDENEIHGLMTYGEVFMFIIPAYFIARLDENGETAGTGRLRAFLSKTAVVLIIVIGIVAARYDNVCYLKAEVLQTEVISYCNRLIARIQSTPGYTKDTPVLYVNDRSKNDEGFGGERLFDPIYTPTYQWNSMVNDYAWKDTMELWCAFRPDPADPDAVSADEIKAMPVYPDEGSIKMIDGVLVVKFTE